MNRHQLFEIYSGPVFRLLEIAAIELEHSSTRDWCLAYARVDPMAVVVCGHGAVRAYGMDARPMELDRLRQLLPDLNERLAGAIENR